METEIATEVTDFDGESKAAASAAYISLIGVSAPDRRQRFCVKGGTFPYTRAACEALDTKSATVIIGAADQVDRKTIVRQGVQSVTIESPSPLWHSGTTKEIGSTV